MIRGGARLRLGVEVSTILTAHSEPPYSATTSAPLPLFTRYEPRNPRRGDSFFSWDVRVGRITRITDRVSARLFLEAFNVLNHGNFSTYVANVSSPQFGQPSEALAPRAASDRPALDF